MERTMAAGGIGLIGKRNFAAVRRDLVNLLCQSRFDSECHTWLVFCTPFDRGNHAVLGQVVGYSQTKRLVRQLLNTLIRVYEN